MLRYRIIYAVALAISIIFYIIYHPWFSWYLLVFLLVLIPLDLFFSLPGMLGKTARMTAPAFLEKGSFGVVTITAVHNKPFPVRNLFVRITVRGDDFVTQSSVIVPTDITHSSVVVIDTQKTGLTVFEVSRLRVVSLLGLFSARVKLSQSISVLVLPPPKRPPNSVTLPRHMILKPKPGGGFSEEHDMRLYQHGDAVRNIHWKLSAKLNSLVIREPLVPPQQSRLVHLKAWNDAGERERALAYLRWVSDYLFGKGLFFYIRYADKRMTAKIENESGLIHFLRNVLGGNTTDETANYPRITRFSWIYRVSGELR